MTEQPTQTLTERQVIEILRSNFRLAAEDCDALARGERGPIYVQLRERLRLVEGAARQIAQWRGDARWLQVGIKVAQAQERCGTFLRSKEPAWRFRGLAEILRAGEAMAHDLETKATGRRGPILPRAQPAPLRQGRPVSMHGLILPETMH